MTILCYGYPATVCIGVAIAGKLMVYYDKNRDGRVDPSEWLNMGELNEDVRFSDSIYVWDGTKLIPKTTYAASPVATLEPATYNTAYNAGRTEGLRDGWNNALREIVNLSNTRIKL